MTECYNITLINKNINIMNRHRWIIVVPVFLLLCVSSTNHAFGQNRSTRANPDTMAARLTSLMEDRLALSEEQVASVAGINLKNTRELISLREEYRGNREKMRSEAEKIREQRDTEMKEILTEEQFVKYEALMEEQQNRMRQGRRGGRRP